MKTILDSATLLEEFIQECVYESTNNPLLRLINQTKYALTQSTSLTQSQKQILENLAHNIDTPIKIAIIGQFSSGKSTFLNALLGSEILPSGIVPVTAKVCEISYGEQYELEVVFTNNTIKNMPLTFLNEIDEITNTKISYFKLYAPLKLLQTITFLDTPGFNSQNQSDTDTTNEILQNVDGIIWLSLIDNVGKNSEKTILTSYIQKYATKSLCVLNQKDRLKNEKEIAISLDYAKRAFNGIFADIVAISAKLALESHHNKAAWQDSNIQQVLDFIDTHITPKAKILKQTKILKDLRRLIVSQLFKIHKNNISYYSLLRLISLQGGKIRFQALQEGIQKHFDTFFTQFDARLEMLSLYVFNALSNKPYTIYQESKNKFGIKIKTPIQESITFLPKDEILSKLTNDENEMLRDFRKLGFGIENLTKIFEEFLQKSEQEFDNDLEQWNLYAKKYSINLHTQEMQILSLKKDYALCLQKSLRFLQTHLYLLGNLLIVDYQNAITLTLERLDSKINYALKKHIENPKEFDVFIPTLENIRDYVNQSFHFGLFQDELLLVHSLYKKTFLQLTDNLATFSEDYKATFEPIIATFTQTKNSLKYQLNKLQSYANPRI